MVGVDFVIFNPDSLKPWGSSNLHVQDNQGQFSAGLMLWSEKQIPFEKSAVMQWLWFFPAARRPVKRRRNQNVTHQLELPGRICFIISPGDGNDCGPASGRSRDAGQRSPG